jgi:hypothetical protein
MVPESRIPGAGWKRVDIVPDPELRVSRKHTAQHSAKASGRQISRMSNRTNAIFSISRVNNRCWTEQNSGLCYQIRVFAPCPMGNTVLESFRIYESLEMGCIPIVERRRWMPYYDRLMPGHPLPSFSTWRGARQFVEALSNDPSRMSAYQQHIAEWWQQYKVELRKDVTSFVSLGLQGSFRSSLSQDWRCRKGINHQVWRLIELLKHASHASLQERIAITTRRIIARALPRLRQPI